MSYEIEMLPHRTPPHLHATGMYDPADEGDACGVGLIADASTASRGATSCCMGVEALKAVWHRGCGRCRRQDRRRRRHPCADSACLLRGFHPPRRANAAAGRNSPSGRFSCRATISASRRAAASSSSRKSSMPATRSMAGARCRSTSPSSARRPMRRGPRSSRS